MTKALRLTLCIVKDLFFPKFMKVGYIILTGKPQHPYVKYTIFTIAKHANLWFNKTSIQWTPCCQIYDSNREIIFGQK